MEYQKIINLLWNINDQPYKMREKNWVEINNYILENRVYLAKSDSRMPF